MDRRVWRYFDFILLGAVILLMALSVAMIYSATEDSQGLSEASVRQAIYGLVGLMVMLSVASFDYHFLESVHRLLYVTIIILLGVVFVVGKVALGAQRWIDLRLFPIQPSEIAKIIVIIGLAKVLGDRQGQMGRFHNVLISLLYVVLPIMLIYAQPDLSTSLVLLVIWLTMTLIAGMRLFHLGVLAVFGAVTMPFVWVLLQDYMRRRVLLFLNPAGDPIARYNIDQALISIGSGGWLGRGFASGTQSQLHFLRIRHTDFIFSVIAEELGLVGSLLLFLLFIVLFWRILRAAEMARDPFGRLICCGVAAMVFFQATVNIGMNLNLLPVTGIPLPFVSYGGNALVTMMIGLGLVQNVVMRHKRLDFE
jgi:rod shape determining protein RodA